MPEFCNRNTKALIFYEKGNRLAPFIILTLSETVLIPEVAILKPCILYDHYRQSILDLVKSETYQKRLFLQ